MPYPIPQVDLNLLDMRTEHLKQLHTLLACIATLLKEYNGDTPETMLPICRAADHISAEQPELEGMVLYLKDAISESLDDFHLYSTWLYARENDISQAEAAARLDALAEQSNYAHWIKAMDGRRFWVAEMTAAVGARL